MHGFCILCNKLMEITLVMAMFLALGVGPGRSVEVEHDHQAHDDHGHCWLDWIFGCHGHHHGGEHEDHAPCGSQDCDGGSHSHVLVVSAIGQIAIWASSSYLVPPGTILMPREDCGQICPDGPSFSLLKPPQLS